MMAETINADWFRRVLADPSATGLWLGGIGVRDTERASRDLRDLALHAGSTSDMHRLAMRLDALLPRCPDPGMALANLERFVAACPKSDEMIVLLGESARTTEILVQLFSTSQHLSELMTRDSSLLDWLLWGSERRDREAMIFDLWAELGGGPDETTDQRLILRRFRQRETLRIGYNDSIRGLPLELTTGDLSVPNAFVR